MSDTERTPDDNPGTRYTDKGFKGRLRNWWGAGRGYRDIWLLLICVAIWQAFEADQERDIALQESRLDGTVRSCAASNDNTDGVNNGFTAIQSIVLAGAALPGDQPGPVGVKLPEEWDSIKPGPLSQQIQRQFPEFPDPEERLKQARDSADQLEDNKVPKRDCQKEVRELRDEIADKTGISLKLPPVPTPTNPSKTPVKPTPTSTP